MNEQIALSPRLRMAASLVPPGARLADIGTDHGYLSAALILEGAIPSAIAADLRPGPLARARETAVRYGLEDRLSLRLCDGLSGIGPEEADAVVIAGMGGETIAAILEAAPWVRERNIPVIVQPMSSMPDLRAWLGRSGYCIETEKLCREGETLYTALAVRAGRMERMSPAQLWAGENRPDPLRGLWLDYWLNRTRRALDGLSQARTGSAEGRWMEMQQVYRGLQEMKKEWEVWQR